MLERLYNLVLRALLAIPRYPIGAMPSPENRTKQVQVDELTFDVIGEREGGFGKVWFLRRPSGAPFHVVTHLCPLAVNIVLFGHQFIP